MIDADTNFIVGLGIVAVLFLLALFSIITPSGATVGLILFSPFLVFYILLNILPKIKKMLMTEQINEPPFDTPNHSATHNVNKNETKDESNNYGSTVKDESAFKQNGSTNSDTTSSSNNVQQSSQIKKAERVLDIRAPYSEDKLNSAYRTKVKIHHPDKENGSEEKFKEIQDAYELLSDKQTYKEKNQDQ